jgi:hypothetical protein
MLQRTPEWFAARVGKGTVFGIVRCSWQRGRRTQRRTLENGCGAVLFHTHLATNRWKSTSSAASNGQMFHTVMAITQEPCHCHGVQNCLILPTQNAPSEYC